MKIPGELLIAETEKYSPYKCNHVPELDGNDLQPIRNPQAIRPVVSDTGTVRF